MYNLKIVSNNAVILRVFFLGEEEPKTWLRSNGFTQARGAWTHIDGRTAGLCKSSDPKKVQDNCHKQFGGRSMLDSLVGLS